MTHSLLSKVTDCAPSLLHIRLRVDSKGFLNILRSSKLLALGGVARSQSRALCTEAAEASRLVFLSELQRATSMYVLPNLPGALFHAPDKLSVLAPGLAVFPRGREKDWLLTAVAVLYFSSRITGNTFRGLSLVFTSTWLISARCSNDSSSCWCLTENKLDSLPFAPLSYPHPAADEQTGCWGRPGHQARRSTCRRRQEKLCPGPQQPPPRDRRYRCGQQCYVCINSCSMSAACQQHVSSMSAALRRQQRNVCGVGGDRPPVNRWRGRPSPPGICPFILVGLVDPGKRVLLTEARSQSEF